MPEYVLGPSIASVIEPEPGPAPTPGRVGIEFYDTPTEPGGKVNVRLSQSSNPTDQRPAFIHAVYVNPPDSVPSGDARTAEWFVQSPHPKAHVAVPQPPADAGGVMTIVVPGVKPGIHFVQTILEYPS
jgi:hypothetical protein